MKKLLEFFVSQFKVGRVVSGSLAVSSKLVSEALRATCWGWDVARAEA